MFKLTEIFVYIYLYMLQTCSQWSEWGGWTTCSVSCGIGVRANSRTCLGGEPGDLGCLGPIVVDEECYGSVCPHLSHWSSWSSCSASCGQGSQSRKRICVNGELGQVGCLGAVEETVPCTVKVCIAIFLKSFLVKVYIPRFVLNGPYGQHGQVVLPLVKEELKQEQELVRVVVQDNMDVWAK